MEIVELDSFTSAQEAAIAGEEPQPWGGGAAESMMWADKQRYVAAIDGAGEAVGVAGVLVSEVEAGGERFEVAGVGGLIVAARLRRQGIGAQLLSRVLELAGGLGAERAMLFCAPALVPRYAGAGFQRITAPVFAEQPQGRVEMPMEAMWRPLRDGAGWPAGRVDVLGLPF